MKKLGKILALALALVMVLSLAACGGNPGGEGTNPPSDKTDAPQQSQQGNQPGGEPVTLNWAIWDKESTAYWTALADGYMKTHENVKIEMTDLGSSDYMTQLAGNNSELDVLSIKDIPGYANLINLDMLEPLNDVLTTPKESFNGVLEQLTAEDGKFYGIPFRSDFWVVFYNKDLFDAAGVDYPSNDMTLDIIAATEGFPDDATITLVYDIYNIAFVNTPKYGYASAVAMVLFAMVLVITLIQFKGSSNDN